MKKIIRLWGLVKCFFTDEDALFLYLLEQKAYDSLEDCCKLSISNTEAIQDLIFHLKSYREIPSVLAETKYPEFRGININTIVKNYKNKKLSESEISRYGDFLTEIEEERAVERDFIFDYAKILTFGFKLH